MKSLSDVIWDGADVIEELESSTDGIVMMVECVAMCGSQPPRPPAPWGTGFNQYCAPDCG